MKNIKIFVSHRSDINSTIINNCLFTNMVCGSALEKDLVYREGLLRDDIGDNISDKKEHFSELTIMYWMWKNVVADYYGLCHYRRYFSFADKRTTSKYLDEGIEPKGQGFLVYPRLSKESIDIFKLDESSMRNVIERSDIILREPVDVRKISGLGYQKAIDGRIKNTSLHHIGDVNILKRIIHEKYPEYDEYVDAYYEDVYAQWFDCFIMKSEIFHPFCSWLFDILFELDKQINYQHYNYQQIRACAYLSEDLFGIYFRRLLDITSYKITRMPLVLFLNTNQFTYPRVTHNNIVSTLVTNETFFQATTTINSIICNEEEPLDIVVFTHEISQDNIDDLKAYSNNRIHIIIVSLSDYSHSEECENDGVDESILYKYPELFQAYILRNVSRVLFITPGMIANRSIAELFKMKINDFYCAAPKDLITQGYVQGANNDVAEYYNKHPYKLDVSTLFTFDISIWNIEKIRNSFSQKQITSYIKKDLLPNSSDFYNHILGGKILALSNCWNSQILDEYQQYAIELTSYEKWKEYYSSQKSRYIINYYGIRKPWQLNNNRCNNASYFWKYFVSANGFDKYFLYKNTEQVNSADSQTKNIIEQLIKRCFKSIKALKKLVTKN